jgi:hypothetical protein
MRTLLSILVATCGCLAACAGPRLMPPLSPARPHEDALLVLTGFGYGRGDGAALADVSRRASAAGIDVYVPRYITRRSLDSSRRRLADFIRAAHLDRYERVHVFAFIAGAWTLNPLVDLGALPNLATIVYDRSPYQERAPRLAVRDLRVPAWLRYGSTIFDVARTPYQALSRPNVRVGLVIETEPTAFVRRHARPDDLPAASAFDCDAIGERYDDCVHVAMRHGELYTRFAEIWPDVDAFMHTGRFTDGAAR